jgi:L-ascorbate metabolism protein UlaG (beta-lactamase superfamily)
LGAASGAPHASGSIAAIAAAVLQNCDESVPFIGPQGCVDIWTGWGVPASRCKVVHPGDTVRIKDVEIVVLESFDRTALVTAPQGVTLRDKPVQDMNEIDVHHDIWSNFQADTREITMLWELKKDRLQYGFKPFIWQVGGKFTYPQDKDRLVYQHPRGFEDAFAGERDMPFPSFL